MAIKRLGAQRFSGLDADVPSLPIDADLVGAIFSSTDTLKFWIFNGTTWNESAGGGGITGINTNSTILDHSTTLADYTSPSTANATSEDGANVAANAVDESTATFWKSLAGINESITIDMGSVVNDFALAFYIDKTQTGITETQFQIKTVESLIIDDTDLKGYWQFEEASGDIINVSEAAADLGSAADITTTNLVYQQSGKIGFSVLRNGTDTTMEAGSSISQWNFLNNAGGIFTIALWFKQNSTEQGTVNIISTKTGAGADGIRWANQNSATASKRDINIQFTRNDVTSSNLFTEFVDDDLEWHFLVGRWDEDGGTDNFILNVDGGANQTFTVTPTGQTTDSEPLQIGLRGAVEFWDTFLDEFSIFNRQMSDQEIADLYNGGSGQAIYASSGAPRVLRTVKVIDLVDQEYNFIRFNGANAQQLQIEGSSGSSLVMAANDLQVLVESDPPLTTTHGQFEINGTNDTLALNGGDPTSSVIEDPQVNSLTLNNVDTQADPIAGASVMWQQTQDANNDTTRIKMKINGSIEEVRFF